MEPKISVVVPVYNVEKYLQACIDSLLGQTMENIELIFVNDASPDNCLAILERNQQAHPDRIRVIDSKVNLMQGGARNLGIRAARAPYVGFLDSDDFAGPDMFRRLYTRMQETDADAVFLQMARVPEDADLESVKELPLVPYVAWPDSLLRLDNVPLQDSDMLDLIRHSLGGVCTGLWKRSLLTDNGVQFPEHMRYEDNYFTGLIRLYMKKIAFVPEIHCYYRQVGTSTVHKRNSQFHFDRIEIENMLLAEVKKRGFFERYHESWEYIYLNRYAWNTINMLVHKFDKLPLADIRRVQKDLNTNFPNWRKNAYLAKEGKRAAFVRVLLSLPAPLLVLVKKILRH